MGILKKVAKMIGGKNAKVGQSIMLAQSPLTPSPPLLVYCISIMLSS